MEMHEPGLDVDEGGSWAQRVRRYWRMRSAREGCPVPERWKEKITGGVATTPAKKRGRSRVEVRKTKTSEPPQMEKGEGYGAGVEDVSGVDLNNNEPDLN